MRFVADIMLKKVCRWMRIFGLEVIYPDSEDDTEIMKLAEKKKAALLTMDVELYRRCVKRDVKAFLVPTEETEKQVASICAHFGIDIGKTFPSETLCPKCNGNLAKVGRKEVEGKVLDNVLKEHDTFWLCSECEHVFWEGSHWEKIKQAAARIKRVAKEMKARS